jgi:hypothetical protein
MPQIIVAADRRAAFGEGAVTFRERVNVADFESAHFANQLVERLGWAVEDADQMEQIPSEAAGGPKAERSRANADGAAHTAEGAGQTDRVRGEPVAAKASS